MRDDPKTASVSIVILNFNGWRDTIECLESAIQISKVPVHLIVVDNASSDDSVASILGWAASSEKVEITTSDYFPEKYHSLIPFTLLLADKNEGYASGNNIGIRFSLSRLSCKYVWVLNNDTVVFPETLSEMIKSFEEQVSMGSKVGVMGCVQRYYDNPSVVQAIAGSFSKWRAKVWNVGQGHSYKEMGSMTGKKIDYVYGASVLVLKQCFKEVGLFDESYFLYFEELDFEERARSNGYSKHICQSASVLHKYRSTISKLDNEFRLYHFHISMIIFYRKHYPSLVFIPLTRLVVLAMANLAVGRSRGNTYLKVLQESFRTDRIG